MHLFSQARGRLRYDERWVRSCRTEQLDGLAVAGAAAGVFDLAGCLADGQRAAREALTAAGRSSRPTDDRLPAARRSPTCRPRRWCCGGCPDASGRGGHHPVRRPAARRHRRRHRPRRRRRPALHRAHQALHHHRHRARPGQDLRGHRHRDHRRTARRPGVRTPAPPRSGRRTPRSPSPRWPAATAAGCFDPERVTALHDWHVGAGRGVRGRRPVEAAPVLPAARRGHGGRRAARVRRRPHRRRHPGRLHARQDRRAGPGRRRCSSTGSTPT